MISKSVERMRTSDAFRRALAKHGASHPSTWAAWARMAAVWGIRRAPRLPRRDAPTDLIAVAAVAYARVKHAPGDSNRTARRRRFERAMRLLRQPQSFAQLCLSYQGAF